MNYWDTSALLKVYVQETDSAYFLNLLSNSTTPLFTANVTQTEILGALHRKEQVRDINPGAANALFKQLLADESAGRIIMIPGGKDIIAETEELVKKVYSQPKPIMLRSLDAIHIASALTVNASTLFTTDKRLKEASLLMGLEVLP